MDQITPQLFADNHNSVPEAPELRKKPDAILDPAGEAGWYLERERVARNMSLEQASEATGVHPYHIYAIENGDMTHMPERMEALEMVAIYSQFLGFEPEPLLEHYVTFLPLPELAPRRHPANPAPMTSAKILSFGKIVPRLPSFDLKHIKMPHLPTVPGGSNGIIAGVAGFFILFAGTTWMFSGTQMPVQNQQIAIAEEITDPMPTATTGPDAAQIKVTEQAISGVAFAKAEDRIIGEPEPVPGDDPDALGSFIEEQVGSTGELNAIPEPKEKMKKGKIAKAKDVEIKADGRIYGASNTDARIVFKATSDVWVSIEDSNGNIVMTQMLKKGDSYRVPNREGLFVVTRDAGLLSFAVDGKDQGLFGPPGKIITGDSLDLDKLPVKS